jgi:hypothetical protein
MPDTIESNPLMISRPSCTETGLDPIGNPSGSAGELHHPGEYRKLRLPGIKKAQAMADPQPPQAVFQLVTEFGDLEALCEITGGWDLDFYQIGAGRFRGRIVQYVEPRFHLAHARFHASLRQRGSAPENMLTFGIPSNRQMEFYWRGRKG